MSILIFFSNIISLSLVQRSLIGLLGASFVWFSNFQRVFELGKLIFLLLVTQPVSTKKPLFRLFGFKKTTFSLPSRVSVYFLNIKSSIIPPTSEIEPLIFSFSNSTLAVLLIASSLDNSIIFSSISSLSWACSVCLLIFPDVSARTIESPRVF